MKLLLTWCLILFLGWFAFSNKKTPLIVQQASKIFQDTINFNNQIKPILVKNCSPCHFPGGKMYDRLPFDKDTTIINHQAGILKRIKGEENLLLKAFVQQNKKDDNRDDN